MILSGFKNGLTGVNREMVLAWLDGGIKSHGNVAESRKPILTHNCRMKRILIVGSGDIAHRLIPLLTDRYQVFAVVRNVVYCEKLRTLKVIPLLADLDSRAALQRLAGLADVIIHLAPPANFGERDLRTRNLLAALGNHSLPSRFIYISTTGVYGDCGGNWVDETQPINPMSSRSRRRVDAEQQIRRWAVRQNVSAHILRVPGIYAAERLPLERLQKGLPTMVVEQDSYSNHIHADDLVKAILASLRFAKPNRIYQVCDGSEMKMGDYFDVMADAFGLKRPLRWLRAEVQRAVSPMMWSFMNESRRMSNHRLLQELKVKLEYPDVYALLRKIPKRTVDSRNTSS